MKNLNDKLRLSAPESIRLYYNFTPNSLKSQIEAYLGEPATHLLLNDRIDDGEILVPRGYPNDIDAIDMDSLNKFKKRLNDVLELLGCARSKL